MKNLLVGRGKYFKWKLRELKRQYCTDRPRGRRDFILTVSMLEPQNGPLSAYEATQTYRVGPNTHSLFAPMPSSLLVISESVRDEDGGVWGDAADRPLR
jgi:hypothetical protein